MGRKSLTGGISPSGDRIQIRFSWKGKELRPTLALKPTAANLKHAARIRELIIADIKRGTLDLLSYFPDYKHVEQHESKPAVRTFAEWAKVWSKLSARTLEDSTLRIYDRHLAAYWLGKFGNHDPAIITREDVLGHLSDLANGIQGKPLSRKTQNNILIPFRGVFELICGDDARIKDPTDGVDNLRVQRAPPDPFSAEEVEVIIDVLRSRKGDDVADYFEFSFFAGLRASEQIALLWQDVDLRSAHIRVRRARVLSKDKERTKTSKERDVELNHRALGVISRQRARTQALGDHVFRNPATGRPWNDEQEQRRIWVLALRQAKVRYRPPKECRDTSVTFALQSSADPVWVANQHGHSLTVMMRDYAKWIPGADRGRNIDAVNRSISANSAVEPQWGKAEKEKALNKQGFNFISLAETEGFEPSMQV